jgi:hypothetical protein
LALALAFALAIAGAGQLARNQNTNAKYLYETRCARCHRLYEPRDYPEEEWGLWMAKMATKARLTLEQEKLVNAYLDAYRSKKKLSADPFQQN